MASAKAIESSGTRRKTLWERTALVALAGLFLAIFQVDVPNGDGRVYIGPIEAGVLVFNPNHLLMEPLGFAWHGMLHAFGLNLSVFAALKWLSGLSALLALWIFHSTLSTRRPVVRVLATAGLFFSASFLSMAIAEEFFMLQMPVVTGAFAIGCRIIGDDTGSPAQRRLLVLSGLLAALATTISINNALMAVALGPLLGYRPGLPAREAIKRIALVWLPGAALGVPLLIGGYVASHTDESLSTWLLSYQGDTNSAGNVLYGITWTVTGLILGSAKVVYGSINNLVLLAELGPVVEGLLSSQPLEFKPNFGYLATTTILFALIGVLTLMLVNWIARQGGKAHALVRFSIGWTIAYLVFNFWFSDISDQFWFQLLLPAWAVVALFVDQALSVPVTHTRTDLARVRLGGLIGVVLLLSAVNTVSVAAPRAFTRTAEHRAELQALLRPDDLLITTGWDDIVWIAPDRQHQFERVLFMELALKGRESRAMDDLPKRIDAHLKQGGRVIVARLFDLDREGRPWEHMAKLGWPRRRLQELLGDYKPQVLATIDGVVFREITQLRAAGVSLH